MVPRKAGVQRNGLRGIDFFFGRRRKSSLHDRFDGSLGAEGILRACGCVIYKGPGKRNVMSRAGGGEGTDVDV